MPLSDIYVCLDEHTVTTNPGNWVINAQWYTKDYVLTHVAHASLYLNSLSKTYIDIYLKYLNKQHAKYTSCLFNKSSIHSKTSINKNISKY